MTSRNTIMVVLAAIVSLPMIASTQSVDEPIRIGLFGGANDNFVGVGQDAGAAAQLPVSDDFADGTGFAPYIGLVFEFNPGALLGFQARIAYDDRTATFGDASNEVDEVNGTVSYVTFEPGVMLNIGTPYFHVTAGPTVGYLVRNAFDHTPAELADTTVEYDKLRDVTFGAWMNLGYDIPLFESHEGSTLYMTPFVGGSWIVDQAEEPESAQTNTDECDCWSTVSLRGGLQLSYSFGR